MSQRSSYHSTLRIQKQLIRLQKQLCEPHKVGGSTARTSIWYRKILAYSLSFDYHSNVGDILYGCGTAIRGDAIAGSKVVHVHVHIHAHVTKALKKDTTDTTRRDMKRVFNVDLTWQTCSLFEVEPAVLSRVQNHQRVCSAGTTVDDMTKHFRV